jgi:hypothetical protein
MISISPICIVCAVIPWASIFDVLNIAFVISRYPVGEYIGMTQSIIGGGYFLTKWDTLWRKVLLGRVLECI